MRVLLVDDEPPTLTGLTRLLSSRGHTVRTVGTCAAARAVDGNFDVAVVDLHLPDGVGDELAASLLTQSTAERIVFYTASDQQALKWRASRRGTVVTKDEPITVLLDALEN